MLYAYYFKHQNFTLAPVYAETEKEAREKLTLQHSWCNVSSNATLIRIEQGTEWERICNYKGE